MSKIVVLGSTTVWGSGQHARGALVLARVASETCRNFSCFVREWCRWASATCDRQHATVNASSSQHARCAGDVYTRGASAERLHKRPVAAGLPDEVHSGGDTGWCAPPEHAADTEQRSNVQHANTVLLWGLWCALAISLHTWRVRVRTRTGVARGRETVLCVGISARPCWL